MSTSNIQTINSPEFWKAGDPLELTLYGVKAVFRYCPPGTFLMGSPKNETGRYDDEVRHKVTLTRGFWLLETPVTQALWKAASGWNRSKFQGMDARPVEMVSWLDCNSFIRKLNAERLAPDGLKFDFPTEAEWEYACRAGTTTRFNCGDDLTCADANFAGIIGPTPVKSYAPNAWGFMICTAMLRNGVPIVIVSILQPRESTRKGIRAAGAVFCAAAVGSLTPGSAGPPVGLATFFPTGATATGSGLPSGH